MTRILLVLIVGLGVAASVFSQAFPAKPVRLVVGFPPGGSGDFLTRLIADEMSKDLGVAVIADNRPGAGGNIAAEIAAKAPADGYTLINAPHHAINIAMYKSTNYQERDFAAICRVATGATVIVVNNTQPFNSLKELIDYARQNPGKLFNASAGFGSAPHLAAVLFESVAGVKFTSVQFKGGGPAAQSLLAGDTNMMFATSPTVMGFIRAGRIKPLAISTRQASPAIPGIPGAEEAGLPGYHYIFWFGLYAPAGTSPVIVRRLHEAAARGLAKPEVKEKIALQGMDATPSASPDAFEAELRAEAPLWQQIVRESGARIE
jgi:tripartite-type tricarboxylate transporter receptor subunit TctC